MTVDNLRAGDLVTVLDRSLTFLVVGNDIVRGSGRDWGRNDSRIVLSHLMFLPDGRLSFNSFDYSLVSDISSVYLTHSLTVIRKGEVIYDRGWVS